MSSWRRFTVNKPPPDTRSYLLLKQPINTDVAVEAADAALDDSPADGFELLLISDPDTDREGAAIAVGAGTLDDPAAIPGLAHFCEHMLLLGSARLPELRLQKFVESQGGETNAFTKSLCTVFYFDLAVKSEKSLAASSGADDDDDESSSSDSESSSASEGHGDEEHATSTTVEPSPDALRQALDIVAGAFEDPLLDARNTKDEVQAVHGEFSMTKKQDSWRQLAVERASFFPVGHPMRQFDCGNDVTLRAPGAVASNGEDADPDGKLLREELVKWHRHHYSSRHTRVCVMSRQSIEEMEAWVVPMFANVKDQQVERLLAAKRHTPIWKGLDQVDGLRYAKEAVQSELDILERSGLEVPRLAQLLRSEEEPTTAAHCRVVYFQPEQDTHRLKMAWPVPSQSSYYSSKPEEYISHILGHEASGSAFAMLKHLGWVSGLLAGPAESTHDTDIFSIEMSLTELGLEHVDEIIVITYALIRLLKDAGTFVPWIWDEVGLIADCSWRFSEKSRCVDVVTVLAERMLYPYKRTELLEGAVLHMGGRGGGHDEAARRAIDLMKFLSPENLLLEIITQRKDLAGLNDSFERHTIEHYDLEFHTQPLPARTSLWPKIHHLWHGSDVKVNEFLREHIADLANDFILRLPVKNPFIASQFEIKADEVDGTAEDFAAPPHRISVDEMLDASGTKVEDHTDEVNDARSDMIVLHKAANPFRKPRAIISLQFASPLVYASPHSTVCSTLLCELLRDYLNDELGYFAEMAHLKFSLAYVYEGIELTVAGYDEKSPDLVLAVLKEFVRALEPGSETFQESRFSCLSEQLERSFRNQAVKMQPYHVASLAKRKLTIQRFWGHEEKLMALTHRPVKLSDVLIYGRQFLSRCRLMMYACGNIRRAETALLAENVLQIVRPDCLLTTLETSASIRNYGAEILRRRSTKWPKGTVLHCTPNLQQKDSNSCVWTSFEIGPSTARNDVLCATLSQILMNPSFEQLRTVETLGYVVWATSSSDGCSADLSFVVQSPNRDPEYLRRRVDNFTRKFLKELRAMPQSEFETYVTGVRGMITKKDEKVGQMHARHWSEMQNGTPRWHRRETQIAALDRLTLEDLIQVYEERVLDTTRRRRLVIEVWGAGQEVPFGDHTAVAKLYAAPDVVVEGPIDAPSASSEPTTTSSEPSTPLVGKHIHNQEFLQAEVSTERCEVTFRGEELLWQEQQALWPAQLSDAVYEGRE